MGEIPTCVRERFHGLSELVRLVVFSLQVLAGVGGLVFLFSGVAISQLWNGWTWRTWFRNESPALSPRLAPPQQRLEKGTGESFCRTREEAE